MPHLQPDPSHQPPRKQPQPQNKPGPKELQRAGLRAARPWVKPFKVGKTNSLRRHQAR